MYERSNPYYEYVAGGTLDMSECRYEQIAREDHADHRRALRAAPTSFA